LPLELQGGCPPRCWRFTKSRGGVLPQRPRPPPVRRRDAPRLRCAGRAVRSRARVRPGIRYR
jgi:hypothetical protein